MTIQKKTRRRPYTGSKAIDRSCRGGGDCPACAGSREHKNKRRSLFDEINSGLDELKAERE